MSVAIEAPRAVVLRDDDNVAVAARPIPRGFVLHLGGRTVEVREPIGLGHKVALAADRRRRAGPQVRPDHRLRLEGRSPPGRSSTSTTSAPDLFERDYAFATERPAAPPDGPEPAPSGATSGPTGGSGTRNYVAVISTVNCSASTSRYISDRFRDDAWRKDFPNVDGVFAITHKGGCGLPFGGPTTRPSSACWPASPTIPTSRRTCSSASAARSASRQHLVESQDLVTLGVPGSERTGRGTAPAADAEHPGSKAGSPGRSRRPSRPSIELLARGQRLDAVRAAGLEDLPGDGMRRLGRQLGRDGQPGPGRRGRPARGPGRHGVPRRDDRDLRRRTPAHPPRRHAGGRREAGRADQVVGVVHRHLRRRDRQQPVAGQQGRRPDDDLREVARRPRQGRIDGPGRRGASMPSGSISRASSSWTRRATTRCA